MDLTLFAVIFQLVILVVLAGAIGCLIRKIFLGD